MPDAPLPLRPGPSEWGGDLADTVHDVQSGIHSPAAIYLALSPDVPGGGPRCLTGDAWRTEFGAVCRGLSHLVDGPLSPGLCIRPPQSGHRAGPVWPAAPQLYPGG